MTNVARNRRSWTDSELAAAVHNARSWRGVLRNLGLYSDGPTHVVKREAQRLGLETGHFGSGVLWTDEQLKTAVTDATSWGQLLSLLGMPPESRRSREKVKVRAAALGLRLDHLTNRWRARHKPSAEFSALVPDRAHLRNAAQSLVMAWFMLRGLWPATPAEPRPYDLLLETPYGVKRLQVKTTTCTAGAGSWYVGIGRHAGGGNKHNRKVPYRSADVDLFVIVDGGLMIYLIPIAAVAGRVGISLRPYRRFIVGSAASMFTGQRVELKPQLPAACAPTSLGRPGPAEAGKRSTADAEPARGEESGTLMEGRPVYVMRWTASDLRVAAEKATSWADLLRQFGYKPSSTSVRQALQDDVRRYEIDTSHFVGQRTWSDRALAEAASTARSWADLLSALGLSPNSRSHDSVRAAARRLGLGLGPFTLGPKTDRDTIGIDLPDQPRPDCLRNAAQCIAAAWFLACGRYVATPSEPGAYDLIVDVPGGLKRVQVKSTTSRDSRGSWIANIGHRPDGSSSTADLVPYRADEVDLFLIVDGNLSLYLIPAPTVAGKTSLSLRSYGELIVGDASSLMASINPIRGSQVSALRTAG
jgi:hypothetical protein